jgi:hypothetical protein
MSVTVAVISQAKLRSIIPRDEPEALYVGLLKITTDSPDDPPLWITTEFSDVFTERLPPELPPSRAVDHEIPIVLPDLAPPFRAIFRLAQTHKHASTSSSTEKALDSVNSLLSSPSVRLAAACLLVEIRRLVEDSPQVLEEEFIIITTSF